MAYLSLYRKYRPQTFAEILGQEHVSETLSRAVLDDRVAHAYLFTGPRGTGKTSAARVLAKALNCAEGPTPTPCGRCPSCIAIAEGSSLDVIEMDAASHSKVDETRDVLAGVPLATAQGRTKVYVIDEVHMLSTGSFNALLKTLEEPPDHVVFILATTEAHKVLQTIVSRTQRFDFRRAPVEVLEKHLFEIARLEGIEIEAAALAAIARHSEGSFRDALSALDQLSSLGDHIAFEDAERMLGTHRRDAFGDLFEAVARGDIGAVLSIVAALIAEGADPRRLAMGVLEHARSLLLLRAAPGSGALLDVAEEDVARLSGLAESFSAPEIVRILDLLARTVTDMRTAPDHRLLLEIALVRAAAPVTDPSATGLLGRIERLERRIGIHESEDGSPAAAGPPPPVARQPVAASPSPSEPPALQPEAKPVSPAPEAGPAPEQSAPQPGPSRSEPDADDLVGLTHVKDAWPAVLKEVVRGNRLVGAYLTPSRPLRLEGGTLLVEVQADYHKEHMDDEKNKEVLGRALHLALGVSPRLQFVARGATPPAPAPEVVEAVEDTTEVPDPVTLLKEGLSAEIVEERTVES
ncbi:MAG TPA: DNA polymerase III subunit gamma/tau [Actinomycetota bacterium]|nr:DNA polymerase III subunit gamma/tau [Actinomycetota bacterium]